MTRPARGHGWRHEVARIARSVGLAHVAVAGLVTAAAQVPDPTRGARSTEPGLRNPPALEAQQLLDSRDPKAPRRVRFEWEPVTGAAAYLLSGIRSDPETWAIQSVERRVTPETAGLWEAHRVTVQLPLGPGAYSWRLVALYEPGDRGNFANPTTVRFEVR